MTRFRCFNHDSRCELDSQLCLRALDDARFPWRRGWEGVRERGVRGKASEEIWYIFGGFLWYVQTVFTHFRLVHLLFQRW